LALSTVLGREEKGKIRHVQRFTGTLLGRRNISKKKKGIENESEFSRQGETR